MTTPVSPPTSTPPRSAADVAYRRTWWSLLLYPFAFVGSFLVGEGLATLLDGDSGDTPLWVMGVAGGSALLVFAVPALVTWLLGRRAVALGRKDGLTPAAVAVIVLAAFIGINLLSGLAQLLA